MLRIRLWKKIKICNNDSDWNNDYNNKEVIIPKGMKKIERAKPRTFQYHYSNENSQGALICETANFPDFYNPKIEQYDAVYSDRIAAWDYKRFERACIIANAGDQNWAYKLPSLEENELKRFAQEALNLTFFPKHVRIIHYFNVSSGYSCPTVEAIYQKV